MSEFAATPTSAPVAIACSASPTFQDWMAEAGGAVAVSTYQAGKVAMIGWDGRQVTLLMREFDKPLGLGVSGDRLVLATRHDIWIFANAPLLAHGYLEHEPGRYDALYLPRATYHTGDLHTHDVTLLGDEVWLAATRFSCLAKVSYDFNFLPVWRPPFVSDLVPEDRCHLNGIAVRDGRPRYVTALGTTDAAGAWRQQKATGGVLIDLESNEIVLGNLAMPHSPRWHDGRLWTLNSGAGELLLVDHQQRSGRGGVPLAGLSARALFLRSVCPGGFVQDPRAAHFRRAARPGAGRTIAVRGGGRGPSQRKAAGLLRVHRRLRGAVRRAVPARRLPPHDSQFAASRKHVRR